MTIGTAPLRDLRRAAEEAEKDAATVAQLQRDLIEKQRERIAELEMEVGKWKDATDWWQRQYAAATLLALDTARAAGYLAGEEVGA